LADYNQNIKVTASTKDAERELSKLEKILKGLNDFKIDLGKNSVRGLDRIAESFGAASGSVNRFGRELQSGAIRGGITALGLALGKLTPATTPVVAGIGKVTTAITGLTAKATGLVAGFGGIGAAVASAGSGLDSAAKAAATTGTALQHLLEYVKDIPSAWGLAAVALAAFAPAAIKAGKAVNNAVGQQATQKIAELAGGIQNATTATQQLTGRVVEAANAFESLLEGASLNQLNRQLRDANKQVGEFAASTVEAWEAAQQLVSVQRLQTAEQKKINDLVRQAKGLQPQDVRDKEVYRRKNDVQSGRFKQAQAAEREAQFVAETASLEQALLKIQGRSVSLLEEKLGVQRKITNEATLQAQRARDGLLDGSSFPIRPQRTVAGVRAMGFPIALPETAQDRKLAARDAERAEATRSLALQKSNSLNAKDVSLLRTQLELIKALAPAYEPFLAGLKKANDRQSLLFRARANRETRTALGDENIGRRDALDEIINKTNRSLVARNKLYEIGAAIGRNQFALAKSLGAEVDLLIKKEQNYNGVVERRLAFRRREKQEAAELQKQQSGDFRKKLEGAAIGGAFPLLFGGGAGSVIGGALGGLNTANPIFSVFTSAIGQMLDQFAAAAVDTGKALRDPITNFQKLADAGLLASKSQEYYISRLIEVGRITEATAIIQGEMVKKIGVSGVNDLIKLGTASDDLTKAWNELSLAMYAFIAGPLAEMLKQLSNPVKTLNAVNQLAALEKDLRQAGRGKDADRLIKEDRKFKDLGPDKGTIERLKLIEQYRKLLPVATDTRTGPEAQQKAADDALAKAERAEALRRQGLQLERQTQDLDLQIADQVYGFRKRADDLERATLDLRRSIEDEIFKKRQDITRIEADNDRKRAQIAIERTDLLLNAGRITNNRPGGNLANQMLDALRQYFRSKAEGEANLQQKQRNFTIEMEDIRRAAGRFQLDVARKVDEIERQGVELARDMERAKLTTARAIYDLQVQAADYQVAKAKEALATMSDPAGLLSGTQSLTQQISGGGFSTQQLQGATAAASKFTGIANMCAESVKAFYKSLGITLPGVTAWADTVRKAGKTMTDWSKLRPGDIVATGRPGDTPHVGVYTGGNNVFHQSASRGLRAGNYPDLGYFKQGGYFVRPDVGVASRGAAPTAASIPAPVLPPPGLPASVGQATAALGRPVPGAPDVSRLLAQDKAMTQMLLNAKTTAMELDATLDGLSVEGFKQQLDLVGKSIDAALTAPLDEIVKKQKDQAAYEREYAGLIQQGTNPALAEQIAQIREQVRLQLEKVETIKTLLTDKEKELEGELAKTTNLKEQKDLQEKILAIKERLAELEGKTVPKIKDKGADAEKGAREDDKGKKIRAYVTELQASLNDTDAMIVSLARTIEGEIGSAMSNAVTNVINGTGTVQQAFSQMFANIGKAFIDMATQMLAKQAVLSILQMIGGGLAGGFKGFSGAGPYQFPSMGSYSAGFTSSMSFLASGGPMAAGRPYIVGEEGPELILPSQGGYVLNADETQQALADARGAFADNRSALNSITSTSREQQTERLLASGASSTEIKYSRVGSGDLPFVTEADMLQAARLAAQEGARMGQQRTMAALKNNPGARRTVGL